MNNRYMSQMNDYLEGGQGSAPRQNGAFANMVPRQAQLMDQPHMLAYINPAEEQMLRDMGGAGIPGPDGIPVYGLYESITGTKFEDTALGGALGVNTGGTFGSGGSLDNTYNAVTGGGYTGNSGSSEDMDYAAMVARNAAAAAAAETATRPTPTGTPVEGYVEPIVPDNYSFEKVKPKEKSFFTSLTGYDSFSDMFDGGGAGYSNPMSGGYEGALSGISNTIGATPYNPDAGVLDSGGVFDVYTDFTNPMTILGNMITGGQGVGRKFAEYLGGTATGEWLDKNLPGVANQLGIDPNQITGADIDKMSAELNKLGIPDFDAALYEFQSDMAEIDPLGGSTATGVVTSTGDEINMPEGYASETTDTTSTPNITTSGGADDDPATSGAVRADIMGAEMGDYIRKYKGGSGAYLPSYMQRYMSGETIDDMFRQFTGEDGKQYYITPTGEVYDADAFIGAATGDTSRLETGNEIVVGYTETDASGNVTSYNNDGTPL